MRGPDTSLAAVCQTRLLGRKWLLAPSYRVGHQWIEHLVRGGQAVVNLSPTTIVRLALDLVADELSDEHLALVSRGLGSLIVDAAWQRLDQEGYLGRLVQGHNLSAAVLDSLFALRMEGLGPGDIDAAKLETGSKADDIALLLKAYQEFLDAHSLVDEADVLRRAVAKLRGGQRLAEETMVLVPEDLGAVGLERVFLDALPAGQRVAIRHPLGSDGQSETAGAQGSIRFFRAIGEVNEVREVLRRCLAEGTPLDEVELLHTDADTYVPLIYATAKRHFAEPGRPDGVPVTFAEGIPASLSRPGRALVSWLRWAKERFSQRILVDMIGDGLLEVGDEEGLGFSYLASLLRPMAIGLGEENYLPKLDEQLEALRHAPRKGEDVEDAAGAAPAETAGTVPRKLRGLATLRRIVARLLTLSRTLANGSAAACLQTAKDFLATSARSVSELDRYASEALIEQIGERQLWLERLAVNLDCGKWLVALPSQVRVLGSGPRPGHLHVSSAASGGHSGRAHTFLVGLDDRRFPGAALQDPILLDRERGRLSPGLPTSPQRLEAEVRDLAETIDRLAGSVTISWPCRDLADDRETFPSSFALSTFRRASGLNDADLDALHAALGPPVSFAPDAPEKSLDESERWLWLLGQSAVPGSDLTAWVEARYPHLARGSESRRQCASGCFGPFNGRVPQAGRDLDPFASDGSVLSASSLETAGRCPRAFFFRNALRLMAPLELEIDHDRWLDAAQFGSLLHDVFRQFMQELCAAGQLPDFERDHRRLASVLQETVDQWRRAVPPPNENALRAQCWQLVRTARVFLQAEEEFCRGSSPRFFEVAIGRAGEGPLDTIDPVPLGLPGGGAIRVRGQVDRVDEFAAQRYSVWDYKLGSGYGYNRSDPFRQGRRVQSVLYLRMVEHALREKLDSGATVERFGYFFPGIRQHGLRLEWNAETLAAGEAIVESLCSLIAAGAFPATDHKDDCQFCDYAAICGDVETVVAQSRALLGQTEIVELKHFRELRGQ